MEKQDGNDIYTIISVFILTIYVYIFVNLLIMINGPSLHLYRRKDKGKFSFQSFLANFFLPYLIFYISILKLKKDLSVKEFIDLQYYDLYHFLNENHNEMDKRKIVNLIKLKIHNLETEISKKKNEHQKGMKRILYGGLVLILLTWIYMYCFLGIYENSYDCLIVNLVLSVVYSLIVSHLVYLLSVSIRKCVIPKDQKEKDEEIEKRNEKCNIKMFIKEKIFYISELFNPQYKYFCFCCFRKSCFTCSVCKYLSCFCSFICCCWWNEKNIEEYVIKKDLEEKRKKREEKERIKKEQEEKEQKRKEQEQKEKEERNKNEKNLHEKDEDDKKSKSESENTSVSVYPSKQQFMKK